MEADIGQLFERYDGEELKRLIIDYILLSIIEVRLTTDENSTRLERLPEDMAREIADMAPPEPGN